jgi:hypothetical protein
MAIDGVRLLEKHGGNSGDWVADTGKEEPKVD